MSQNRVFAVEADYDFETMCFKIKDVKTYAEWEAYARTVPPTHWRVKLPDLGYRAVEATDHLDAYNKALLGEFVNRSKRT